MINDFIEQCRTDEARGLLEKGYTDKMIKQLEKQ